MARPCAKPEGAGDGWDDWDDCVSFQIRFRQLRSYYHVLRFPPTDLEKGVHENKECKLRVYEGLQG